MYKEDSKFLNGKKKLDRPQRKALKLQRRMRQSKFNRNSQWELQ